MQTGIYRKLEGHSGVGELYEFDCLARDHTTGEHIVVYIPLRIEPNWDGPRHCCIRREEFEKKFIWVAEGLVPGMTHPGEPYRCPTCFNTEVSRVDNPLTRGFTLWCRICKRGYTPPEEYPDEGRYDRGCV